MKRKRNNRGAALLTVLGVIAVITIALGMLHFTARQQTHSALIARDLLIARAIAESGLNKSYNQIRENFDKIGGFSLKEEFSEGSYEVTSKVFSGANNNRAQLTSKGRCRLAEAVVSVDLENYSAGGDDETDDTDEWFDLAFDLLVGGVLDLTGNFGAHVNDVHSNGSSDMGGSATVEALVISTSGTVSWKDLEKGKVDYDVTIKEGQPPVNIFTEELEAAIESFKEYAEKNGAVYDSADQIPVNPPGGVAWCKGSDDGWGGDGNGCFVFEGVFNGKHLNIDAPDGLPALIVLSPSDMKLNAGTVLRGAVILPNSTLKFNGHAAIYGPLLIGQELGGLGTADLYAGAGQGFTLPPKETASTEKVVITAWH